MVGCSPRPHRDSHRIAALLQGRGNHVLPVNPQACPGEILGEPCHPDLAALPAGTAVDVVDIFRRADAAGEHVDEAIAIGARAVWMQLGVVAAGSASPERGAARPGTRSCRSRCPG